MNELKYRNVLYISYDGLTDPLGQSQVIPYLIELSKKGLRFTVVSFEKPDSFNKNQGFIKEQLSIANIKWKPIKYHKNPPILSGIYDTIIGIIAIFNIAYKEKKQVVHCRGHYLTSLMAFVLLIFRRKMKYIFDMRGFWIDERLDGGLLKLSNPVHRMVYWFFKRMERKFLNRANYIITLTYAAKHIINEQMKIYKPIAVIPCCADLSHFYQRGQEVRDEYRKKLNIAPNDFVLVYLGSVGTWYLIKEMLDFFYILLAKNPSSKFLFLTPESPEFIMSQVTNKNAKEKIIILKASRNEVPCFLTASDASIFFIKPTFSKQGSSPTKHGEILGCGLPLVCNGGVGDIDRITKDYNAGIVVEGFDNESYSKAIFELLNQVSHPDKKAEYREAAKEVYSLILGADEYYNVYLNL